MIDLLIAVLVVAIIGAVLIPVTIMGGAIALDAYGADNLIKCAAILACMVIPYSICKSIENM